MDKTYAQFKESLCNEHQSKHHQIKLARGSASHPPRKMPLATLTIPLQVNIILIYTRIVSLIFCMLLLLKYVLLPQKM